MNINYYYSSNDPMPFYSIPVDESYFEQDACFGILQYVEHLLQMIQKTHKEIISDLEQDTLQEITIEASFFSYNPPKNCYCLDTQKTFSIPEFEAELNSRLKELSRIVLREEHYLTELKKADEQTMNRSEFQLITPEMRLKTERMLIAYYQTVKHSRPVTKRQLDAESIREIYFEKFTQDPRAAERWLANAQKTLKKNPQNRN